MEEQFENELQRHYGLLLGIESPWRVKAVELQLEAHRTYEIARSSALCLDADRAWWARLLFVALSY